MNFFAKLKLKKSFSKSYGATVADQLAKKSSQPVMLAWNGDRVPFEIHEVNFLELMNCGKFPNLLLSFVKHLAKEKAEDATVDVERLKQEQLDFYHELARKSMVTPRYQEVFDSIKARLPEYEEGDAVIPIDFLQDLYKWYLRNFSAQLKKNLEMLNTNVSAARRNTGAKPHQTTSAD